MKNILIGFFSMGICLLIDHFHISFLTCWAIWAIGVFTGGIVIYLDRKDKS